MHIQEFSQIYIYRGIFAHTGIQLYSGSRHYMFRKHKGTLTLQYRLFFQITVQIYLQHFFIFASKVNIQYFFLPDNILIITITIAIAYNSSQHASYTTHASTPLRLACHTHKHATLATHGSTPPTSSTSPTLAQIALHFSNSISDNFEEQLSFEYCRKRVHEYLKNVSACKKLCTVSVRVHYSSVFCEHLIPVPTFTEEISQKSMPPKELFH